MSIYYLPKNLIEFPDPEEAGPDGLLAVGGDLSVPRLISAYGKGIFPWYSQGGPILWWTPDPRLVLEPSRLKVSRSLAKVIRKKEFLVTLDTAFTRVMLECARAKRPQGEGTWIVDDMVSGFTALHESGFAHSVETWVFDETDGEFGYKLAGGLYGVSLGRAFFGESMFHKRDNASKAALVYLVGLLKSWDFEFIDCQQTTPHMLRFGAREISRKEFNARLEKARMHPTRVGTWSMPPDFSPL